MRARLRPGATARPARARWKRSSDYELDMIRRMGFVDYFLIV
ncbi:MAG: hypothetical protein ACLUNO_10620 [Oscillospiraceae bacterium]